MSMQPQSTQIEAYTQRLEGLETVWWKKLLPVQAPYRWNLKRLKLGYVLDVGCGIGRNLKNLDGQGLGVDHNPNSVALCRQRGLRAMTTEEFLASPEAQPGRFDSILAAHVLEHLQQADRRALVRDYLPYLKSGGRLVLITPQEVGYASDASHVQFVTNTELRALAAELGLVVERDYSFPFPRAVGKLFIYNEFVVVLRKP